MPRRVDAFAACLPLLAGVFAVLLAAGLCAQEYPPLPPPELIPQPVSEPAGPPVTLRGVVTNAATGQPLRRALVKVGDGNTLAALSDAEGRFEIPGVPSGVQPFVVLKPGYESRSVAESGRFYGAPTLRVASGMADLALTLSPENAIYGHLTLSTGVPALGIGLHLVRQTISDGRVDWEDRGRRQTTPDGAFRFAGLTDGTYLLLTEPESDNDEAAEPTCNAAAPAETAGFASQFYRDAQTLAGAARIVVVGGQNAEVNLALNLVKFHLFVAQATHAPAGEDWDFEFTLADHGGQPLDYPLHEEKNHTVCAYLPDGAYTLSVQAARARDEQPQARVHQGAKGLRGLIDFSMDGQAVRTLRVELAPAVGTPVHVRYEPGPPKPEKLESEDVDAEQETSGDAISVTARRANVVDLKRDQVVGGDKLTETAYELEPAAPGEYWIEVNEGPQGICLGAVTAAGQSLTLSMWTAGAGGAGAPIDVVARTDCASLTVRMPATLDADSAGEGASLSVYAVPEFDTLAGVGTATVEQFGERSATLKDLTPGRYRVYAFREPREIEYRTPGALDRLGPGQEVTLEPGGATSLTLEGVSP